MSSVQPFSSMKSVPKIASVVRSFTMTSLGVKSLPAIHTVTFVQPHTCREVPSTPTRGGPLQGCKVSAAPISSYRVPFINVTGASVSSINCSYFVRIHLRSDVACWVRLTEPILITSLLQAFVGSPSHAQPFTPRVSSFLSSSPGLPWEGREGLVLTACACMGYSSEFEESAYPVCTDILCWPRF